MSRWQGKKYEYVAPAVAPVEVATLENQSPQSLNFPRVATVGMLCLAVVKIWMTKAIPLTIIADSDEKTFLLQAQGLLSGHWLGDYTVVTLAKNPFYSMFLAASFVAGVPALMAQQLLYAVACAVFVLAVRPAIVSWRPYQLVLLYALLVFNPMSAMGTERLLRNHLYATLGVLLIASGVAIINRTHWGWKPLLKWFLLFTFALTAQWLTREESIWVMPFLVVYTLAAGWLMWRSNPSSWRRNLVLLVLPYCVVYLSVLTVEILNKNKYGVFVANEQQSRGLRALVGAIHRVNPVPRDHLDVVTKQTREQIYVVSPSFAELRTSLEGVVGQFWADASCQFAKVCTDNDINWGLIQWELRHAALVAGHQGSATDAEKFYDQIAREINSACADGRLSCQPMRSSTMPAWESRFLPSALRKFWDTLKFMVSFGGISLESIPTEGDPALLAEYAELSLEPVKSTTSEIKVSGWALSTKSAVELSVRDADGRTVDSTTEKVARPDLVAFAKRIGYEPPVIGDSGFQIRTSCSKGCYLYVRGGPDSTVWQKALPLDGSVKYYSSRPSSNPQWSNVKDPMARALLSGDAMVYLDSVVTPPTAMARKKMHDFKLTILETIGVVYQRLFPFFFVITCLLFAVEWLQCLLHRGIPMPVVVSTLIALLFLNRLAILVLVDVLAIPGIARLPEYAQYGYPLLLMFAGLIVLDPLRSFRRNEAVGVRRTTISHVH
jgi:hypothetical protein